MEEAITDEKRLGVIQVIIGLYKNIFGTITAEMYNKMYQESDIKTILASFKELMVEYAGDKKGAELIHTVYTQCNLKPA